MGLFSEDCKRCGHPALAALFTNDVNVWMNEVVAIWPNDDLTVGMYDGYGRVNDIDYVIGAEAEYGQGNTMYHRACWEWPASPRTMAARAADPPTRVGCSTPAPTTMPDPRVTMRREQPALGAPGPAKDQHEQVLKRGRRQLDPDGWSFGL